MEFVDSLYATAVYPILTQETVVSVPNLKRLEYATESTAQKIPKTNTIRYGPFSGPAMLPEELRIHYELAKPLIYFPKVERQIELSHLGGISVNENIELKNDAAALDGEFNRIKINALSTYHQGGHIFRELHAQLPRRAYGVYYTDVIGNVSTSVATREVRV